ncbi:hypothetical protein BOX15_Mlig011415g1 [Macrostomum lignano]|uniref:Uncharacterized protein n=1 Tax=Macrostomum lignano TaxID=282301 RepID=A0A267DRE8_9PLAT|nr:hypothetical protein BOX15_Mlig011415g1 [Macrostomum lignano]
MRRKRRRNEPPQLVFLNSPYTKRAPPSPVLATDRQPAVGRCQQPDSRWIQHDFALTDGGQPASFVNGGGLSFSRRRRKQQQQQQPQLQLHRSASTSSSSMKAAPGPTVAADDALSADSGAGSGGKVFCLLPPRSPPSYKPGLLLVPASPSPSPPSSPSPREEKPEQSKS